MSDEMRLSEYHALCRQLEKYLQEELKRDPTERPPEKLILDPDPVIPDMRIEIGFGNEKGKFLAVATFEKVPWP